MNSETEPGCRDALVFLIKLFTKIWIQKKIQNENWAAKIKKNPGNFFSFEIFFNTQGQKICDYEKFLTEISSARNLIQFQGDNIFFLGKIPGN